MAVDTRTESERIVALGEAEGRAAGLDLGPEIKPEVEVKPEPEADVKPEPDVKPEGELPAKGSAEDPLKKPASEERMIPETVFQRRLDEITAEKYQMRQELEALKQKVETPKAKAEEGSEYSDAELRQIILKYQKDDEHPEYAVKAQELLMERRVEAKLAERDAKRNQEDQVRGLVQQHQQVWKDLQWQHADLANPSSELFRLANEEYQKIPIAKRQQWPDEMQYAVERAVGRMQASKNGKASAEATRAAAASKKGVIPLGSSGRAAGTVSSEAQLDKLHAAAVESGNMESPEWMTYMRAAAKAKTKTKEE